MCLGELAQVVEVGPAASAVVRSAQRTMTVSLMTLDEAVAPGDWVVCHSGFALSRLTPDEATEAGAIRGAAAPATTSTPTAPPRKGTP